MIISRDYLWKPIYIHPKYITSHIIHDIIVIFSGHFFLQNIRYVVQVFALSKYRDVH